MWSHLRIRAEFDPFVAFDMAEKANDPVVQAWHYGRLFGMLKVYKDFREELPDRHLQMNMSEDMMNKYIKRATSKAKEAMENKG